MKTFLFSFVLFFYSFANAQVLPVLLNETVTIEQKPVSIREWNDFLQFIKKDSGFTGHYVKSMEPDQWESVRTKSAMENQAVTGVSWYQATEYCKWKTVLSTYLHTHTRTISYVQMQRDNDLAKTRVTYRLPTGNEVNEMAANSKVTSGFVCVVQHRKVSWGTIKHKKQT